MDGLGRSDFFGHGRSSPCARESASRIESSFRRSIAINRDDNDVAIEKTATSTGSCRHFVAPPQSTPLRCPTTTKMRIVTRHHPQRRGIWLPNSSARFATSSFTNPSSVRASLLVGKCSFTSVGHRSRTYLPLSPFQLVLGETVEVVAAIPFAPAEFSENRVVGPYFHVVRGSVQPKALFAT